MYIGDWMERGQRYFPDALAVVDVAKIDAGVPGRFTYRDMNCRANALAHWLRTHAGVERSDRVAILAQNGVEYLDALFACGKLGAVLVPLNWRCHAREIVELAALTSPSVLLCDEQYAPVAQALAEAKSSVRHRVYLSAPGAPATPSATTTTTGTTPPDVPGAEGPSYQQVLAVGHGQVVNNDEVDAEDILLLLFTGGTTGLPKAARLSYRMIAWNTLNTLIHELQRGDVTITHTPMFHTGGLLVYTVPLLTLGGTVVIMRKWTAEGMLRLIERERVTLLFCVPAQYRMMMVLPTFADASLATIRFLTSGGAPLPVPIIERYRQVHDVVFKQGFGMTEFGPGAFSMAPEFAIDKVGSIGHPNYFIDANIVDDHGRSVPAGQVGELVLRGPSMCSGYFGKDTDPVDARGWFHTGDLARRDDDGFYYITDRKKDMFISGGENVYPAEVERALYAHPAVSQCAVIGVPDSRWGEVGKAFIVPAAGAQLDAQAVIDHCREHVARYKVPRHVEFMDALPMSAAGKILKRELRARATSMSCASE